MNIFDRILFLIAVLSLALLSLFILSLSLGLFPLDYLGTSISAFYGRFDLALIVFLFLLASIRLFFVAFGKQRHFKSIIIKGELGDIKIALIAIENLVHKVVREMPGVKQIKAKVHPAAEGVVIKVKTVLNPEYTIPTTAAKLQELVGQRVQETMGIQVYKTEVLVENIGGNGEVKPKVKVQ
ncbi:MAG: alkaline shock response membrane anchor protein AmaP [bacterium]|jgi:uncharacterized alkaline shock family protein YloU